MERWSFIGQSRCFFSASLRYTPWWLQQVTISLWLDIRTSFTLCLSVCLALSLSLPLFSLLIFLHLCSCFPRGKIHGNSIQGRRMEKRERGEGHKHGNQNTKYKKVIGMTARLTQLASGDFTTASISFGSSVWWVPMNINLEDSISRGYDWVYFASARNVDDSNHYP